MAEAVISTDNRKMNMAGQEPKKYDCVIWGGYAWGNTGDELCLAAALERAQREFGPKVAVLSRHPEYTAWLFPEVLVVPFIFTSQRRSKKRKNIFRKFSRILRGAGPQPDFDSGCEWVQCLRSTRRLYLAGGGYLTDLWPMDSVMAPLELAIQSQVPISTAPVGIGPFKSDERAEQVAKVLGQTELKVRDQVSYDFCRAHGLKAALERDDAFALLTNWPPATLQRPSSQRPRKIGVCILPQRGQDAGADLSGWWTQCLRGLQRQHPEHEIEGFCFHTSLAAEFSEMVRLFRRAGLPAQQVRAPVLDFRQATDALREYDLIISARFHAVVAANVFQIPNIAIAAGDYYLAKMNAAVSGHENVSTLVNPVLTTPEALLTICQRGLARPAAVI